MFNVKMTTIVNGHPVTHDPGTDIITDSPQPTHVCQQHIVTVLNMCAVTKGVTVSNDGTVTFYPMHVVDRIDFELLEEEVPNVHD